MLCCDGMADRLEQVSTSRGERAPQVCWRRREVEGGQAPEVCEVREGERDCSAGQVKLNEASLQVGVM